MKKKVLLTGATGFVGRNILPVLQDKYDVFAPTRKQMNIKDYEDVKRVITSEHYDAVIHLASPSPVSSPNIDTYDRLFEDCLNMYLNIISFSEHYGKLIYSGSGAEYDKRFPICGVSEDKIGESLPIDAYGRAKYIMNNMARNSGNAYNFRIFACYGPGEYADKFITHAIRCCMKGEPITIRKDCIFDYMYVDDYAYYVREAIETDLKYHDYNICSSKGILLSEIAGIVQKLMDKDTGIIIADTNGLNNEYTGDNARLLDEIPGHCFISIEEGIRKLIDWELKNEKESC